MYGMDHMYNLHLDRAEFKSMKVGPYLNPTSRPNSISTVTSHCLIRQMCHCLCNTVLEFLWGQHVAYGPSSVGANPLVWSYF